MKAPFPWYGGKSRFAANVWEAFGRVDVYVEPFFGSGGILFGNPHRPLPRREIVCDLDGMVCNFFRALREDPDKLAYWCDWPTIHQDLSARHVWLHKWRAENARKLSEDVDFHDAQAAGWWVWGLSNWIGTGWCADTINDKVPHCDDRLGGCGVSRQANGRRISDDPMDGTRLRHLLRSLADRLANVVVVNRDWSSILSPTKLSMTPTGPGDSITRAIFFDPPYRVDTGRLDKIYAIDGTNDPAVKSFEWAVENGRDIKIAYACQVGDFELPEGWTDMHKRYPGRKVRDGRDNETVMFSPACSAFRQQLHLELVG